MKRTVRLASLPLNQAKLNALHQAARSYARAKRSFVGLLRSPSAWHHLEDKRGFRDWTKAEGLYPSGMNVHLVDQAAFDAVDSCIRHIESRIATGNIRAKIWRRFLAKTSGITRTRVLCAMERLG